MIKKIAFSIPLFLAFATLHAQTANANAVTGEDTTVYEKVDTDAVFPGGQKAWITFIQHNLHPEVPTDNGAPKGKYVIWVKFIVTKEGAVKNISAETKKGFGMEQEVIRLISVTPAWVPAKLNGKPVNSWKRMSETFEISEG